LNINKIESDAAVRPSTSVIRGVPVPGAAPDETLECLSKLV